MKHTVLKPGRNCWKIVHAPRLAFLIDGEAYFRALFDTARKAERQVFILCWDFDSRTRLIRGDEEDHGYPGEVGDFLNRLAREKRDLRIKILMWDFAIIFSMERERFPIFKLNWATNRRLDFRMDSRHPISGSHHQKVSVIDDRIGFCGGMDPSKWRWDTARHLADDDRRTDPHGELYPPFHDLMVMADGEAAVALGDLCRTRWQRYTGKRIEPPQPTGGEGIWPDWVRVDVRDADVAIVRTEPEYEEFNEVRESEYLFLDAIKAAEEHIYIENQYFTSPVITNALCTRLQEEDGPEVVIILRLYSDGWLQQNVMDTLRYRMCRRLVEADRYKRLRIFYPDFPRSGDKRISVHSKLMVVDGLFARIGSSNITNRSLGLDSECDMAVEAGNRADVAEAIRLLQDRLLAHFLDCGREEVRRAISEKGSLIKGIDSLRRDGDVRTLKYLDFTVPEEKNRLLPDTALLDPERPMDVDDLLAYFAPDEEKKELKRKVAAIGLQAAVYLAMVAAWAYLRHSGEFTPSDFTDLFNRFTAKDEAVPLVLLVYILSGFTGLPVTFLVLATFLLFGGWLGFGVSLGGVMLSGALFFWLGRLLGRDRVRTLAGKKLNNLSRRLARHGFWAVAAARLLPVAPYHLVNLVAGASRIGGRDFFFGSFVGQVPGIAAIGLMVEGVNLAFQWKVVGAVLGFVLAGAVLGGMAFGRRVLLQRERERKSDKDGARVAHD